MKRTWKAMALVSVASFLLAACAGDGGYSSEATPSPSVDEADALLEFAECMREHGIDEYPDPVVDENGAVTIPNVRMSATREELADAEEACKDLLPEDQGPGEVPPEVSDALLNYAECMREHGIDFPDPDFSGGGDVQLGGEGVDRNDPDFQAADDACRHYLEEGGVSGE